jgi:lysozyme
MRASSQLHEYLKRRERFRATPYLDQAGKPTIGYGHLIRPHERKTLTRLSRDQAEALLVADVGAFSVYLTGVATRFPRPLAQHEFDGLLSLAFNVGLAAYEQSTMHRLLKAGDFAAAAAQFDRWIYVTRTEADGRRVKVVSRGLVNRRRMDRAIFERGEYAA